jgi:hypothetical protein
MWLNVSSNHPNGSVYLRCIAFTRNQRSRSCFLRQVTGCPERVGLTWDDQVEEPKNDSMRGACLVHFVSSTHIPR